MAYQKQFNQSTKLSKCLHRLSKAHMFIFSLSPSLSLSLSMVLYREILMACSVWHFFCKMWSTNKMWVHFSGLNHLWNVLNTDDCSNKDGIYCQMKATYVIKLFKSAIINIINHPYSASWKSSFCVFTSDETFETISIRNETKEPLEIL